MQTPEQKTHWAVLLLSSLAAAAAVSTRQGPSSSHAPGEASVQLSPPPKLDPAHSPSVDREQVSRTIRALDSWLDAHWQSATPKPDPLLELEAFGYARIARGPHHARLATLLSGNGTSALERRAKAFELILESGRPLSVPLPFAPSAQPLGEWVEETLNSMAKQPRSHGVNASEVGLLAMAQLAGAQGLVERLGASARAALLQLNHAYRPLDELRAGTAQASDLNARLHSLKHNPLATVDLSIAALRAVAITREESLMPLAARHIRSLLFRAGLEGRPPTPEPEQHSGQASGLAMLVIRSQLIEALHAGHLVLPGNENARRDRPLFVAMRQILARLLDDLQALEAPRESSHDLGLNQSAVTARIRALRALRAGRVALGPLPPGHPRMPTP